MVRSDYARPAITAVNHVQVATPAGREPAARSFYGELLGMPEIPKPGNLGDRDGAWFASGEQQIHCGVEPEVAASRRPPLVICSATGWNTF